MTNENRTPEEIERDIAAERARMSDSIDDLQDKFSVDSIVNDIGTMVRDQGGELGRTVSDTVARNPAAVALVGVGLAWLFLGKDRTRSSDDTDWQSPRRSGRGRMSSARWDDGTGLGDAVRHGDAAWYDDTLVAGDLRTGTSGGEGRVGQRSASSSDKDDGMMGRVRSGTGKAGEAVSGAADSLRHSASDLSERLSHGLEDLTKEARARVVAARRRAFEARQSSQAAIRKGRRATSDFYMDQPLVVGALAVAAGAAIGAALPHSRFEDDAMGDSSDRLFDEAQAVLREERDKALAAARTTAKDVKDEAKGMASELADHHLPKGRDVGDTVAEHASDAATRLADRTTGTSKDKQPGKKES